MTKTTTIFKGKIGWHYQLPQSRDTNLSNATGLDCSLLGAIGMHYAHLSLGLGLGLGLVLGLGVGLALVFSET